IRCSARSLVLLHSSPYSFSLPFFLFTAPSTSNTYTLSLHDALPIYPKSNTGNIRAIGILPPYVSGITKTVLLFCAAGRLALQLRSEEHTSELQSRFDLVCRLLLEKKKSIMSTIQTDWTVAMIFFIGNLTKWIIGGILVVRN